MAKVLTESRISSRAERKRLAPSDTPYWRGIDRDMHLGYRKGKRGGVWLVRWRAGKGYRQKALGTADDEMSVGTLDFDAAMRAAREVVSGERVVEQAKASGPALTVRSALETYMDMRDARESERKGRTVRSDARGRIERYVTGKPERGGRKAVDGTELAELALHALSERDFGLWRAGLPKALKHTTKARLYNDVRAALNDAYTTHRTRLPPTLPATIKHGLKDSAAQVGGDRSVAREDQILTQQEVSRLLVATREVDASENWEGDLFRLVTLLAATGARFSQIVRVRVGDVQSASKRIMVPVSQKGKGAKGGATPVPVGEDVLVVLKPILHDRPPTAYLLERWRNKRVGGTIKWQRDKRGAWATPSEMKRAWDIVRVKAGLPDAIPYALRHTSIVRCLAAMLPTRLVAAMHDTSVAMIERHYGRYIVDGLDELAARAVVPLVPQP